ncbi:cobalamin biosynthesis protein [Candidatus Nitrosotenuis cloacae]|uniref:cobalamin biosynthesis protein n=1 Tax=Candidatus Nitrosotenuis cloacae TaxID=1603555 RepID=UPI0022818804|nr:cobalamin biosynthesis protein [Candidatus Nitrosotenuis cloacae]
MILASVLILAGAIIIDLAFGDPKNRFHPTAWVGTLIAKLVPFARGTNPHAEKLGGLVITVFVAGLVAFLLFLYQGMFTGRDVISTAILVLTGALLLKTTIAIRGLERHGRQVMEALSQNNLEEARSRLSMLVKRNTKDLDKNHIVSGVLETTSENIVDGVTGPVFYFAIFGLPGAFVYRTVNTIDSMVGYKTELFRNVGWFGANCDKVLNYLPSRITAYVMILAALLIGADWKNSLLVIRKDGKNTSSPNAGYPMAAMAGALGAKFEKIDHYTMGNGTAQMDERHFESAIKLLKVTSILFCIIVAVPIISILYYLGWWIHV